MSKKIIALEKDNEMMKQEINELRNSEMSQNRFISELNQKFERLGMVFEWHTHQEQKQFGPVIFLKEEYEKHTGVKLDANLQPIPPSQTPPQENAPKDDSPGE